MANISTKHFLAASIALAVIAMMATSVNSDVRAQLPEPGTFSSFESLMQWMQGASMQTASQDVACHDDAPNGEASTVTLTVNGETVFSYTDECAGDNVAEGTCNGDTVAVLETACETGQCVNGACVITGKSQSPEGGFHPAGSEDTAGDDGARYDVSDPTGTADVQFGGPLLPCEEEGGFVNEPGYVPPPFDTNMQWGTTLDETSVTPESTPDVHPAAPWVSDPLDYNNSYTTTPEWNFPTFWTSDPSDTVDAPATWDVPNVWTSDPSDTGNTPTWDIPTSIYSDHTDWNPTMTVPVNTWTSDWSDTPSYQENTTVTMPETESTDGESWWHFW